MPTLRCTALTETELGMVARGLVIPRDSTVAEMRAEIEAHRQTVESEPWRMAVQILKIRGVKISLRRML